ncbi:energy transducer TonB [Rhodoferax sediminis]|jgi:protein TonB|uniref:Energy transducer TonB n=1 Tax=Rhodoferax sediminis TaxID=2509614 RepID=A0A515DC46_9BURK|nr:energy transducer TonB [Rhodoferax sediminis]QDL37994.1 energy transducer TonB [Rhodoferax sediminis]
MALSVTRPFAAGLSRNTIIVASVVLFHLAALWALQAGLLHRAAEIVVPVEMLSQLIEPPAPKVDPPKPVVLPAPPPVKQPVAKPVVRVRPRPAPQPVAIADSTPAPAAPIGVTTPQPPAPPAPVMEAPAAPVAPPAPAKVELPSSNADYLQNPKPPYPPISKRLGEQGKVIVRVLIGVDGLAQKAELKQSSGFDRLDRVALDTVLKWRYVPGKRGGVAEAMWFNVPINFVLE